MKLAIALALTIAALSAHADVGTFNGTWTLQNARYADGSGLTGWITGMIDLSPTPYDSREEASAWDIVTPRTEFTNANSTVTGFYNYHNSETTFFFHAGAHVLSLSFYSLGGREMPLAVFQAKNGLAYFPPMMPPHGSPSNEYDAVQGTGVNFPGLFINGPQYGLVSGCLTLSGDCGQFSTGQVADGFELPIPEPASPMWIVVGALGVAGAMVRRSARRTAYSAGNAWAGLPL
jgi:hypothetical protein